MNTFRNFIDGDFVDGSGEAFEDRFPTTGEVIAKVGHAGKDDVDRAVTAAKTRPERPLGQAVPGGTHRPAA